MPELSLWVWASLVLVGVLFVWSIIYILRTPKIPDEAIFSLLQNPKLQEIFSNQRTIVCPKVAVITVQNGNEEQDHKIAEVIGAVLKSNAKANLEVYEKTFGIKIIHVDHLKRFPSGTDDVSIGEEY